MANGCDPPAAAGLLRVPWQRLQTLIPSASAETAVIAENCRRRSGQAAVDSWGIRPISGSNSRVAAASSRQRAAAGEYHPRFARTSDTSRAAVSGIVPV